MNRGACMVSLFLALLVWCAPVRADVGMTLTPEQQRSIVEEAQSKYDEGIALRAQHFDQARKRFQDAAEQFELLARSGVSNGKLYYNLANAQLQAGMVGPAVLNYRRAQLYMPGDPSVASNLEFARSQVRSRIPDSGKRAIIAAILEAVDIVPRNWRLNLALGLYVLVWTLAMVRVTKPEALPRSLVWWCAGAAILLGATVLGPQILQHSLQEGVVMDSDVVVRMGNGDGFDAQFAEPIHEGVEFAVLQRRGEWIEIELPNGGTGWIRAEQAQLI